jgi:diguanylate cyclase (GGDEF)-like protein
MGFDPLTLLTIAVIALVSMSGLLLVLSFSEREANALRWFAATFLCGAVGIVLLLSSPHAYDTLPREFASAVFLLGYGFLFTACRRFNRRPVIWPAVFVAPILWLALCWTFTPSVPVRVGVVSAMMAVFCLACAAELRFGDRDAIRGRNGAAIVLVIHGLFYLSRSILHPILMPGQPWIEKPASPWGAVLGAETLVFVFFFGFLTIAMTRERTAQRLRKASLEDVLTGIGNRRALIQSGRALLERGETDGHGIACILFDLDHFKTVNDTHGHDAGDRLLIRFATMAVESLPLTCLFCRIGGEEFAALLPDTGFAEASAFAETIRAAFEHCAIPGRGGPISATVSAGISVSAPRDAGIEALLSRADVNLYRAKARGRNRVEDDSALVIADAPPTLADIAGEAPVLGER